MKLLVIQAPKHQAPPYKTHVLIRRLHERDHTTRELDARTVGMLAAISCFAQSFWAGRSVDRIIVQNDLAAAAGAWLAWALLRRPYVLIFWNARVRHLRHWQICPWIVRSIFKRAQVTIVLNTAARDEFLKFGVRLKHLALLPPPTDASPLADTTLSRHFISELLPDAPYSLAALLRAFAAFLEAEPNAQLHLHGPAVAVADAEQRIREMGLEANILTHDTDALDSSHGGIAIAFCTQNEAPNAAFAFDALAHGLPLVAARHFLLNDWLKDGETALLVPPGDEAALADALRSLVRDPARAKSLSEAAQARLATRHNWELFIETLLSS